MRKETTCIQELCTPNPNPLTLTLHEVANIMGDLVFPLLTYLCVFVLGKGSSKTLTKCVGHFKSVDMLLVCVHSTGSFTQSLKPQ